MRTRRYIGGAVAIAVAAFLGTFSAAPLPESPPFAGPWPPSHPPSEMRVYRLATGVTHRSAAFAYRGGSFFDRRDFSMNGVLVKHPRGDLLIDTGFGRDIDRQFATMPLFFRLTTSYDRFPPARDQLDAAGYDRRALRAIVLTHAHWDHVSGVADFPGTPVWIPAAERRFIDEGGFVTRVARAAEGARFEEYGFEERPYLGFARSHDVHGDGAIVIVPAPGHTPGSVIVFLNLPDDKHYAFVGDLVWQREGILEREERPWLQRSFADADPENVRETIVHMAAIAKRFPDLVLVPAHDARGFEDMPDLAR